MSVKKDLEMLSEVYIRGLTDAFNMTRKSLDVMEDTMKVNHQDIIKELIKQEDNKCAH